MKLVTWNINGYRAISGQNPKKKFDKVIQENKLFEYIESEQPDILCLQETKAHPDQIKDQLRYPPGYHGYYHACSVKKGYSGVVTFSKQKPENVNYHIGVEKFDGEGRIVETDFGEFVLFNVYFPNGQARDERLQYKLEFYDAFFNYCEELRKKGRKIIVSGDYNTAHHPIDLARPKENEKTSGFMPIEREKLDYIESLGWRDTFRLFDESAEKYTWWSQRMRARERNVGWRIDYNYATEDLESKFKNAYIQADVMGSDHCPCVLELDF